MDDSKVPQLPDVSASEVEEHIALIEAGGRPATKLECRLLYTLRRLQRTHAIFPSSPNIEPLGEPIHKAPANVDGNEEITRPGTVGLMDTVEEKK